MLVGAIWLASGSGGDVQIVTQRVASVPIESVAPRVTPAEEWSDEVTLAARPSTAVVRATEGSATLAGAVAVRDDGYLLTSGRALEGRTRLLIHTADGVVIEAELVGYDPVTDLSVLHADTDLEPAMIAAEPADDGDVVAMLNPDGDSRRQIVVDQAAASTAVDGDHLVGLLALDGAIGDVPPGSPVIDHTGAVVGITTATSEGAPVAVVPIELAAQIATELIEAGVADHPRIGVTARDTESDPASGALISSVEPTGPADLAGIVDDDVIVEIEGDTIESMADMVASLRRHEPGDIIEILIARDDEIVSCLVELARNAVPEPA